VKGIGLLLRAARVRGTWTSMPRFRATQRKNAPYSSVTESLV
jgi:hypothetical protein